MVDLCSPLIIVANCFGCVSLIGTGTMFGENYNGRAGNSLRTSSVPFLPKAGLELILRDPLLMLVLVGVWGEGGPTVVPGGRSLVFIRFHIVTLRKAVISKKASSGELFKSRL